MSDSNYTPPAQSEEFKKAVQRADDAKVHEKHYPGTGPQLKQDQLLEVSIASLAITAPGGPNQTLRDSRSSVREERSLTSGIPCRHTDVRTLQAGSPRSTIRAIQETRLHGYRGMSNSTCAVSTNPAVAFVSIADRSADFSQGKYKYNAWKKFADEGLTAQEAQKRYVEFIDSVFGDFEFKTSPPE